MASAAYPQPVGAGIGTFPEASFDPRAGREADPREARIAERVIEGEVLGRAHRLARFSTRDYLRLRGLAGTEPLPVRQARRAYAEVASHGRPRPVVDLFV